MNKEHDKCDIPKCMNPVYLGWNPTSIVKGLKVCEEHWKKHCDEKDPFSLWNFVDVKKPRKKIENLNVGENPMATKKVKIKVKGVKAATKVKKSKTAASKRPVGKTTKLGVIDTWIKIFNENPSKRMTDEQISTFLHKEFPERESAIFDHVSLVRNRYNKGALTKGKIPLQKAISYEMKDK